MSESWGDVGEGFENKDSVVHLGVGYGEVWGVYYLIVVEEEVEVDCSWALVAGAGAVKVGFDLLKVCE